MSKQTQDKKEKSESFNELLTLTPRVLEGEEKERIKPYLTRLKQAIDQEDILNIALTGNYGSGKSTILRTFENEYSEYEYLPISLATFNNYQEKTNLGKNEEIEKDDFSNIKETESQEDIEQQLEISILQQIFYKVSADKIPDSRFKRIKDFDNTKTSIFIGLSAIWIISAFILFGFDYINDLNPGNWGFSKAASWIAICSASYFVFGLFFLMKYVYRSFSNSKINKFSFKGVIELGEESVFNKNLDEILYFFEKTDYNVVVFEDVDRFDTTGIFTKLRELNKLINHCDLIDRDINFVYAVKDTVFKDKTERVKFFDFIIPVIPFINSKNASEQLNKLIQEHELTDKLPEKFVTEVVSMIHDIDMRLLINTFHEYTVFKENIGDEEISHEELFSIIVYKNLYPEDFSKLYHEQGKLYEIISKREVFEQILTRKLKHDNKELEREIENIEQHSHIKVKELRAVYILRFLESLPSNVNAIYFDDKQVKSINLIEDENFKKIREGKNIKYTRYGHSRKYNTDLKFNQLEGLVNKKHAYLERAQFIKDKNRNKANSIKEEILANENKIREIGKLDLAKIFEMMDTNKVYGKFKENDLVRYLLAGGYLNENYLDYISLFHEVNLTREEFKYLRAIKSYREPNVEFEVSNQYALINDLDTRYFSNKSILNYDLLEYLVNQSSQFRDKAKMFYASLENREKVYFDFIIVFLKERPSCRKKFIPKLIKHRKSIWGEIFHHSNLPNNEILEIVKYFFQYSNADDLQQLENLESLRGYLQGIVKPISTGASLVDRKTLQEFVTAQNIKFKNLEKPDNQSISFFAFIVNNNAFEINYSNVLVILNTKLSDVEKGKINQSIYTHICESDVPELKNYIEKNLNEFVSKVLLHDNSSHSEKEDALVALLNDESLGAKFKSQLINIQKYRISSLDKLVDHEAQEIVTSANKIKATWENVYFYYDQLDESFLNETIIKFLNNEVNHTELSESSVFDLGEVEHKKLLKFRDDLLYCSDLNLVAYNKLLKSLKPIKSVDFSNLNSEMAEILLEKDILELNSDNFDGLKSLGGSLHISLIEKNIQELVENTITLSFDQEDWYSILNSKNITIPHKRELLFYLTIDNLSYIKVAEKVIDLHPKQKIESYGFDKIKVLLSHGVSNKKRIALLLNYINDFSDDQLKAIVGQFGKDYADLIGLYKSPTFPNNNAHFELLKELDNRDIISSFSKAGDVIRAHCRRKK